jgi:hypothetical protein
MTIEDIIRILNNKIMFLNEQQGFFEKQGDLNQVTAIQMEIGKTQELIEKLKAIA